MKKVAWSAVIGSGAVCALYWTGRFSHSSGPPSELSVDFTMFFLMPGYYFFSAMAGLLQMFQTSQKVTVTLMIVFDCVLWSLIVLLFWNVLERLRKPATHSAHGK
jgi:hypothetical protein